MAEIGDELYLGKTLEWDEGSAAIYLQLQDASAQALRVREDAAQSAYSLEIENSTGTTRFGVLGIATTTDMIEVSSIVTTANVLDLGAASLTTGKVIDISDLAAITTGKAIHVDATGVTQTDGILVHIDSASTALTSTGRLLLVDHTGNAGVSTIIAEVKSAAADETVVLQVTASAALAAGVAVNVSAVAMTTGTALAITNLDALTTGTGVNITSNSSDVSARSLLYIKNDNTAAVLATPLTIVNDAVVGTGSKFKCAGTFCGKSIWVSTDGTSPHGALGASQDARVAIGDICLGVTASAAGKIAYCVDSATNGTWQVITSA